MASGKRLSEGKKPPGRKYYPRCSCGTTKRNGACPHGCGAFLRPSRIVRLAGKGKEPARENGSYLTPKEIDDGMISLISKLKVKGSG